MFCKKEKEEKGKETRGPVFTIRPPYALVEHHSEHVHYEARYNGQDLTLMSGNLYSTQYINIPLDKLPTFLADIEKIINDYNSLKEVIDDYLASK